MIATHLFDDTLPEGFGVAYLPDDSPPFLLTNSRAFNEANKIAQPKTCVINRQTYYTLRFAIYALDDPAIPSPRDDLLADDSSAQSLADELLEDSEKVLDGESFHVDHDVIDDVDDIYDHDGFMADDLPPSESDNGEEDLSNLSSQLLDKPATTVSTQTGYGSAAMGAMYSVIKTAFLAPTYFCTGCGSSTPATDDKSQQAP